MKTLAIVVGVLLVGGLIVVFVFQPVYEDREARARADQTLRALRACQTSIAAAYEKGGGRPAKDWGCASGAAAHVRLVTVSDDGAVLVTFGEIRSGMEGTRVTLVPLASETTAAKWSTNAGKRLFGWRCGGKEDGTTIHPGMLPGYCRGSANPL